MPHCNCVMWKLLSHVWIFVTPWTIACQASLFMGFCWQESFSGGYSQPRDRTQVSRIADGVFTAWATREAIGTFIHVHQKQYCSVNTIQKIERFQKTRCSFSNLHRWSTCVPACLLLSHVWVFATPWTVCSPPGSSVHGILQARMLEWVAIPSSTGSSSPKDRIQVSHIVGIFFTIWATGSCLCRKREVLNHKNISSEEAPT